MKRFAAALVLAAALVATAAQAKPRSVLVRRAAPDDTFELLAAEYYGDRRHAGLIRLASGIEEDAELRRGQRVRVPVGARVVTREGALLGELAAEHLGDERRAEFLAEYNEMPPEAYPPAGVLVRIPLHVEFRAAERTSLRVLAARYMRGARDAELLRAYNFLADDVSALEEGESILIPALHIAVRSARMPDLDEDARTRVETRRAAQDEARAVLPWVRHAWRRGEYRAIARELAPLDRDYLDADLSAELGMFLGGAHVALAEIESAEAVFQEALTRDPDHEMSAYHFSPAVRAVWEKLGGRIDTSSR